MASGWISIKGLPTIKIKVRGANPKPVELEAIIDTGNDGYLLIPHEIAFPLGMEIVTVQRNNSNSRGELFPSLVAKGEISLDGKKYFPALIDVMENGKILLGVKLFRDMCKTLEVDFTNLTVEVKDTLKDDI